MNSRYLLSIICYLLSNICYLLSDICYLLSIIWYLLSIIRYLLSIIYHLSSDSTASIYWGQYKIRWTEKHLSSCNGQYGKRMWGEGGNQFWMTLSIDAVLKVLIYSESYICLLLREGVTTFFVRQSVSKVSPLVRVFFY